MALSYVQYPGDGITETFAVPFEYLDKTHLQVRVALDIHEFTWDDPNTIRITPAPAVDAVVELRRVTPRENRMVDFVDGSVLTESDLDIANLQTFYIVQEAIDIAGGTLELLSDGSYGAGGRRIKELGNPVENRDAVTKEYFEGTFLPQMNALLAASIVARDGAVTARQAAETALASAVAARDLALLYRNDAQAAKAAAEAAQSGAQTARTGAETARTGAETAKTGAETAKAGAETARDTATQMRDDTYTARQTTLGYRDTTLTYRNDAETFKNQAAASAAAAATFDPAGYYTKVEINSQMSGKWGKAEAFYPKTSHGAWTVNGWLTPQRMDAGAGIFWSLANQSKGAIIGLDGGGGFFIGIGPGQVNNTGNYTTTMTLGGTTLAVNGFPVITTNNFPSYFGIRRLMWGQAGQYGTYAWAYDNGNGTFGPQGCFLCSFYSSGSDGNFYVYYAYLQWAWAGTWYTTT